MSSMRGSCRVEKGCAASGSRRRIVLPSMARAPVDGRPTGQGGFGVLGIERSSLTQGGRDHSPGGIPVGDQFFGPDDDDIDGSVLLRQSGVDAAGRVDAVAAILDDQQVDVAVVSHLILGGGSEQDDPLGVGCLDDAVDERLQIVRVRCAAAHEVHSRSLRRRTQRSEVQASVSVTVTPAA